MFMQSDESPFSFNLMPLTDGIAIDRGGGQHLNVSLPQPINYSNLVIHSNQLTQTPSLVKPSAPNFFTNVPESIAYTDVIGRELKREETKANLIFNKHYKNKVNPIAVRPLDVQCEGLHNNVNLNIHEAKHYNKLKLIIGLISAILFVVVLIVSIITPTLNSRSSNSNVVITSNSSSYTIQSPVICTGSNCGCAYSPCLNNGVCKMITSTSYSCSCPLYFSGTNCQFYYNPCTSNPCLNGGTCSSPTGSSFICTCKSGYSGIFCQTYNPCFNNQCRNGATCSAVGSNYVCVCPYFYSGVFCQVFVWN